MNIWHFLRDASCSLDHASAMYKPRYEKKALDESFRLVLSDVTGISTGAVENFLFLPLSFHENGKRAGDEHTRVLHTNQVMSKELLMSTFCWNCRKSEIFPLQQWKVVWKLGFGGNFPPIFRCCSGKITPGRFHRGNSPKRAVVWCNSGKNILRLRQVVTARVWKYIVQTR